MPASPFVGQGGGDISQLDVTARQWSMYLLPAEADQTLPELEDVRHLLPRRAPEWLQLRDVQVHSVDVLAPARPRLTL